MVVCFQRGLGHDPDIARSNQNGGLRRDSSDFLVGLLKMDKPAKFQIAK